MHPHFHAASKLVPLTEDNDETERVWSVVKSALHCGFHFRSQSRCFVE